MKKHLMTTLAAVAMLAIGCKQSVETASEKFNALPKPVQTTVRAAAPNQEITAVDHDRTDGMDQYEITIKQGDQSQKMIVAADGRVIRSDLAQGGPGMLDKAVTRVTGAGAVGTKFSSLPEKVQSTIQKSAPETEIVDIERHEDNGRVYYEVEFKDQGKNPTIQVAEDGTLIQSLAK